MSSLHTNHTHRPRSHSASSRTPKARRTPEASWRVATKRAHPQHSFAFGPDLSSPYKWDVDVWRRGKRPRKDITHSFNVQPIVHIPIPPNGNRSVSRSAPTTPVFASTSTEFHLFPKRDPSPGKTVCASTPTVGEESFTIEPDLTRLHSDAFCELQRSIVENGEGLVRRMRDYEHSRSRSDVYSKAKEARRRGRKRNSLSIRPRKLVDHIDGSDAEDDVQIFAGEQSGDQLFASFRKPRTQSLGLMGSDMSGLEGSERCSSPGATCDSVHSTYLSDDEDNQLKGPQIPSSYISTSSNIALTPALSHTYSNSANSSLVSLPLPPPASLSYPLSDTYSPMLQLTPSRQSYPPSSSASRSEKAIAALTLAMANGAGGLNDYEALRTIQAPSALDVCQVGELWH